MTCDLCGKREAAVHLTEVINDQTRELHLCETCARQRGELTAESFGLGGLLAGLADLGAQQRKGGGQAASEVCRHCGMSYDDFRGSGRLGCGGCYETFHAALSPLLRRIHGAGRHVGRKPKGIRPVSGRITPQPAAAEAADADDPLRALKARLQAAVEKEAYEEAAELVRKIQALEGKKRRAG